MLPLSDGIPARRFPIFLVRIPAWIFLGLWFLYQLIEASFGLFSASANGGGVAFFAHVGGFIFGLLVARLLARAGQAAPRERRRLTGRPAGPLAATGEARRPWRRCASGVGSGIVKLVTTYQQ